VDELEIVNKEMYSSRLRDFSVKGRQLNPRKDSAAPDFPHWFESDHWQPLGEFTAANRKGAQQFKLPFRQRIRCVRACVQASVCVRVCVCVRACVRACMRAGWTWLNLHTDD